MQNNSDIKLKVKEKFAFLLKRLIVVDNRKQHFIYYFEYYFIGENYEKDYYRNYC